MVKKKNLGFKEWWMELFEDERGHTSIKPVIALMGGIFLCGSMLATAIIPGDYKPMESLINAVMIITIAGMGGDTIDKYSAVKKPAVASDDADPDVNPTI